jgi:hypothetical protein
VTRFLATGPHDVSIIAGASLTGVTLIGGGLVAVGAILVIGMAILGRRKRDKDA